MPNSPRSAKWPAWYQIRLDGHIDAQWGDWFHGMTSSTEADGTTIVSGLVVDQAELHGLLRTICDLGMTLVSVNVGDPGP